MYKTTYKNIDIYLSSTNYSGIRYYTRQLNLRAQTLQGMKRLINNHI
jgi:hypothetical protein